MSTLALVGPVATADKDVVNQAYVTNTLLAANLSQGTVDAQIVAGYSGYATKAYVDTQDALNATKSYIDAGDATRLHLSQVGANSGVAPLEATGLVDTARIPVDSTQRYPKPFWSPDHYTQSPVVVTATAAGSYSWICPDDVTTLTVECWGASGAGGQRTTNGGGGGGGGGEYARENTYVVVPGEVYAYTVGAGGVTGVTAGNGANSFFDTTGVVAHGGSGVAANTTTGGAGGTGSTNTVHFNGGAGFTSTGNGGGGGGSAGPASVGTTATSSTGAVAVTGGGAGGNGATSSDSNGSAGGSPGGGGGGARRTSSGTRTGGAGAPGKVVLTYVQPGSVSAVATETTMFPCLVTDPGFTYKLLVFGQLTGKINLDNGEYPITYVRVGSTAGQIIAYGAGVAEYYASPAPGSASSQAIRSSPFTAPSAWANITGWSAVNSGGYTTTLSGDYIRILANELAILSASITFSGGSAGSKSTVSTSIRIVTSTGTVVATGAQVDGGSGTATVTWTGNVALNALYGVQVGETGANTYATVTAATFTVTAGTLIDNVGPVTVLPSTFVAQTPKTGDTTLYIDLLRSGASSTVTVTPDLSGLMVVPIPV